MSAGKVFLINAALVAGLAAVSVAVSDQLPAAIPQHFGWSGEADTWTGTSRAAWFTLPLIAAACGLVIYVLSVVGRRRPGMYNLPRKAQFLEMSAARRQRALDMLEVFLAWLSVTVTIEAAAVQFSIFSTATGRTDGLSLATVVALIVGTAGLSIGGALFFQRMDERIGLLWKEEQAARVDASRAVTGNEKGL